MTETGILYYRTANTPRKATTYPDILDELKSTYIPNAQKIIFETRSKQFQGFQKTYKNKIRKITHINTDGQLSQKVTHYGLDLFDLDIFGNFKTQSDAGKLGIFEQRHQTPTDYENGIMGLYIPISPFLNKDPGTQVGYVLEGSTVGRVARLNEIWDFKIKLMFGGTL